MDRVWFHERTFEVEGTELTDNLRHLARRCLAGDQRAMLELVDRFRGQVFGLCYRMLGHREDAEDAAQETFVRALRNLRSWDPSRDFEPWLLAIAGNRCRTALARRMRRPSVCSLVEPVAEHRPDLHAARHLAEEVHLALNTLRPQYRQAFLLFHEQEMSYAAIADVLQCPIGTVRTWIHRARRELIRRLQKREVVESRHAV
ncbi:MAG: sigma-70 family RNA polymerase sigma factor [Pirellulaceae bacterium]|nr:sigma-70 family RNA polymerase sigma factor [Pirellulaceae bacterium]